MEFISIISREFDDGIHKNNNYLSKSTLSAIIRYKRKKEKERKIKGDRPSELEAPTNHHSTPTLEKDLDEEVDLKVLSRRPKSYPASSSLHLLYQKGKSRKKKKTTRLQREKAITDHPIQANATQA